MSLVKQVNSDNKYKYKCFLYYSADCQKEEELSRNKIIKEICRESKVQSYRSTF